MRSTMLHVAGAAVALLPVLAAATDDDHYDWSRNFTFDNGQILTPGLAVLNAPQPGTPMGGDTLHISLDITGSGRLPQPPYADDSPTAIHNITMFLSSYHTGRNFTITNGTASEGNYTYGDILQQQPGSTVKHINWVWPDCLVGDGAPGSDEDSDRGLYNISIRQNFRINDTAYYTIFDVPILVTNSIEAQGLRPGCDELDNEMVEWEDLDFSSTSAVGIPLAGDGAETIEVRPEKPDGEDGERGDGRFGPDVRPGDVVDGAAALGAWSGAVWLGALAAAFVLL